MTTTYKPLADALAGLMDRTVPQPLAGGGWTKGKPAAYRARLKAAYVILAVTMLEGEPGFDHVDFLKDCGVYLD